MAPLVDNHRRIAERVRLARPAAFDRPESRYAEQRRRLGAQRDRRTVVPESPCGVEALAARRQAGHARSDLAFHRCASRLPQDCEPRRSKRPLDDGDVDVRETVGRGCVAHARRARRRQRRDPPARTSERRGRQNGAGFDINEVLDDAVTRILQARNSNKIQARLVEPVPGLERARRVPFDEPARRQNTPGVIGLRRQFHGARCERPGFVPFLIEEPHPGELEVRVSRCGTERDGRFERLRSGNAIAGADKPDAFRHERCARRVGRRLRTRLGLRTRHRPGTRHPSAPGTRHEAQGTGTIAQRPVPDHARSNSVRAIVRSGARAGS